MSENNNTGNNGGGRTINTGGGSYREVNEGTYTEGGFSGVNISGGIGIVGATNKGDITYTDNRVMGSGDAQKLAEMFSQLQEHLKALPENTPEEKETKEEATDAVQTLHQEVEAVKKDPEHKPNRITMNGLTAAFKKVGGPVLSTAISIMGFPAVGAAINQFADKLKTE